MVGACVQEDEQRDKDTEKGFKCSKTADKTLNAGMKQGLE